MFYVRASFLEPAATRIFVWRFPDEAAISILFGTILNSYALEYFPILGLCLIRWLLCNGSVPLALCQMVLMNID